MPSRGIVEIRYDRCRSRRRFEMKMEKMLVRMIDLRDTINSCNRTVEILSEEYDIVSKQAIEILRKNIENDTRELNRLKEMNFTFLETELYCYRKRSKVKMISTDECTQHGKCVNCIQGL
jgi:hypothetical protein